MELPYLNQSDFEKLAQRYPEAHEYLIRLELENELSALQVERPVLAEHVAELEAVAKDFGTIPARRLERMDSRIAAIKIMLEKGRE
jgi:hypothetical protein